MKGALGKALRFCNHSTRGGGDRIIVVLLLMIFACIAVWTAVTR